MTEFKNEEVVVNPGETIPGLSYNFPGETNIIRDQISKAAENFAAAVQRQYGDFLEHNQMYNPFRGFRIDIMFDRTGYKVFVQDQFNDWKGEKQ